MDSCCNDPRPYFRQGAVTLCSNCGQEFKLCNVLPASDDGKRSSGIGQAPDSGPNVQGVLILLLESIDLQKNRIDDLTNTVKFLAEQVKTLVDALADDTDPDAPLTNYMSGKPI